MNRKNTVSWVDGKVLTELMGELQLQLMSWQMYAYDAQFNDRNPMGGDQSVLVAAINLRTRLDKVIKKSKEANEVRT